MDPTPNPEPAPSPVIPPFTPFPPVSPTIAGAWGEIKTAALWILVGIVLLQFKILPGPTPTPVPNPIPVPVPTPTPVPNPTPGVVDFFRLGASYRGPVLEARAASWEGIAGAVEAGGDINQALADSQDVFTNIREQAFRSSIAPELAKLVKDPANVSASERQAVAKAFRELAGGFRAGP